MRPQYSVSHDRSTVYRTIAALSTVYRTISQCIAHHTQYECRKLHSAGSVLRRRGHARAREEGERGREIWREGGREGGEGGREGGRA
eukprot:2023036-Rhodomonas_salina.1